ncbi:MAG: NlpC/P60 family protein [Microbacteriaceae bacterium]|nr:NlpC/P60 family protein [Microbacteriaceae bacterium]MCI1206685.1 NlpC/P60 family protein [Microbacteriaceae bacterium]
MSAFLPDTRKSVFAATTLSLTGALLLTASLPANAQELPAAKTHSAAVSSLQRIDTTQTAASGQTLSRTAVTASAAPVVQTAATQTAAAATQTATTTQTTSARTSTTTTTTAAPASVAGSSLLSTAYSLSGIPYVWGGITPAGFDCSGFVQYVFAQHGISLPRTSQAQTAAGSSISVAQAQPGDLVSWGYHIGIYLGNGKMIDAPRPGQTVGVHSVWGSPVYVRIG